LLVNKSPPCGKVAIIRSKGSKKLIASVEVESQTPLDEQSTLVTEDYGIFLPAVSLPNL